jgi:glycine/D-amino acid oxidase-like deaminating enzyme
MGSLRVAREFFRVTLKQTKFTSQQTIQPVIPIYLSLVGLTFSDGFYARPPREGSVNLEPASEGS